jgi:RAD50-interacting protein 1
LRRLDVAKGYVELLVEAERLRYTTPAMHRSPVDAHPVFCSAEARRTFQASPQAALKPYRQLQKLAHVLKQAQPAAEYAAPQLVHHVDSSVMVLWQQMKDSFSADFEKCLDKMRWPGKDIQIAGDLEQEWSSGVTRLLELQEPELDAREEDDGKPQEQREPIVLLPLEVMVKPLELRFRYHFEGDRPTNRLDKVCGHRALRTQSPSLTLAA